jgi:hypothetical protein
MSKNEVAAQEVAMQSTNGKSTTTTTTIAAASSSSVGEEYLNQAKKSVRFEPSSNDDDEVFLLSKASEASDCFKDAIDDDEKNNVQTDNATHTTTVSERHKESVNSNFLRCFKPPTSNVAADGTIQNHKHSFKLSKYIKSPKSNKKFFSTSNGRSKSSSAPHKDLQKDTGSFNFSKSNNANVSTPSLVSNVIKFFRFLKHPSSPSNGDFNAIDGDVDGDHCGADNDALNR